jgi:asparagine N-glycosylation enzyme membrane subunit Stt3
MEEEKQKDKPLDNSSKSQIKEPKKEEENTNFQEDIEKRKKKLANFFKQKSEWVFYAVLAVIMAVSVYIRTLPMKINSSTGKPGLWDITTNTWTLGPDLDPFLFLRWAKYIAEHGKLFVLDIMRSVPLSHICSGAACTPVDTSFEMKLLPTMISWLYHFLAVFYKDVTVTYAAIIFPVIMAVLTGIAFFLFARKVFYKENKKVANIIALISTTLFVLIPSLLPRTIAGIPEKESAGFFFLFLALYFFLEAFTSEKLKKSLIFGTLAGLTTGVMNLVWGGGVFLFIIISAAVFIEFIIGRLDKKKLFAFCLWIIGFTMLLVPFSLRYSIKDLFESTSTSLCFIVLFILITDFIIFNKKLFKINEKLKKIKLPPQLLSIIIGVLILILAASAILGFSFVANIFKDIISNTVHPIGQGRFSVTVAENAQPYFISDWENSFGPIVFNIPLYFWLFFIGSVFLFNYTIKPFTKKEKIILTGSYVLFLICLIFSKYSSTSILNGDSGLSLFVYFGGVLAFAGSLIYVYYKNYKEGKISLFSEINFPFVLYLITLTIAIIAARGAVRLTMVLGAISPIAIGFLAVKTSQNYLKEKEDFNKLLAGVFAVLIIASCIFTAYSYYNQDKSLAENYIPGIYQWQWQNAMSWVRTNTSQNAVFAHWWDYGYWVQSIGERATVLDGGNAVGYWNYFMGRNVLTSQSEQDALDFLYAHNVTHLLIDSTDIGKYGAFSSIGSNLSYDRYSWIPEILLDDSQTQEKNNQTMYVYPVRTATDDDIIIKQNASEIFLPKRKTAVAAITVTVDKGGNIMQPVIYFVYNNQQYPMPLRYAYSGGKEYDFKTGLEAGIFIFPLLKNNNNKLSVVSNGAAFYLSSRTIHSQLAELYLMNKPSKYFKLVHTEQNLFVDNLKQQGLDVGNFIYYQGFQAPIKIWEVSYPAGMKVDPAFLETVGPKEVDQAVEGEY